MSDNDDKKYIGLKTAFDIGVQKRQLEIQGMGFDSNIYNKAEELFNYIYADMKKAYPNEDDIGIKHNADYFTQIAMIGYILSGISVPTEELKNELMRCLENGFDELTKDYKTKLPEENEKEESESKESKDLNELTKLH